MTLMRVSLLSKVLTAEALVSISYISECAMETCSRQTSNFV